MNDKKTFIWGSFGSDFGGESGRFELRSVDYNENEVRDDEVPEWEVQY
jgi:hypothetical protein